VNPKAPWKIETFKHLSHAGMYHLVIRVDSGFESGQD
jgi:hypothetical protein